MKPCGTTAAYQRHIRAGQPPCDDCRIAANEARNQYRRIRKPYVKPQRAWKIRDDVLDRLALEGWVTSDMLAMEGGHNTQAVQKVLRVLRDEGLVESRAVVLASGRNHHGYEARTEWRAL